MDDPGSTTQLARRLADIDDAMWLRAREGDVAAAKLVYARLAEALPPPTPPLPPSWDALLTLLRQVEHHHKEIERHGLLVNAANVGAGPTG